MNISRQNYAIMSVWECEEGREWKGGKRRHGGIGEGGRRTFGG